MSLLPADVAVVRERRRQSSLVVAAVVLLAALLLVAYVGRRSQVSNARDKAERAEAGNAALRQEAARLSQVTTVDSQLQERRAMVAYSEAYCTGAPVGDGARQHPRIASIRGSLARTLSLWVDQSGPTHALLQSRQAAPTGVSAGRCPSRSPGPRS